MHPSVALNAEGYEIVRISSKLRKFSPRFDVMSIKDNAALAACAAALTVIAIALKYRLDEFFPFVSLVELLAFWCRAALPCGIIFAVVWAACLSKMMLDASLGDSEYFGERRGSNPCAIIGRSSVKGNHLSNLLLAQFTVVIAWAHSKVPPQINYTIFRYTPITWGTL